MSKILSSLHVITPTYYTENVLRTKLYKLLFRLTPNNIYTLKGTIISLNSCKILHLTSEEQ